ncbi:hypothetical protein HYT04_00605, partial [Candidatus Kaiserbacteria bacterium]|nr:hypothetical protein [Candidatus Kaiserbacteria bacterium]
MKNFVWALVIVVILGGGYLLWQNSLSTGGTPTPTATPSPTPTPIPEGAPMSATVTYSASGFSPA